MEDIVVMGDAELVPARFGQKRFETQLFRPLELDHGQGLDY